MIRIKKKFVVIAYDIADDNRRNKVSKLLEENGTRVNLSVFECMISNKRFDTIRHKIEKRINPETDSIIYYSLCIDCFSKITKHPPKQITHENVRIV